MERLQDILLILLGWLLGALTPGITDAIRRPKYRSELLMALRAELYELRYKLAMVAHNMRGRTGTLTEASLELTRTILLGYKGSALDAEFQETLSKLFDLGLPQYIALSNSRKGKGSPYPVPYELPFLEAHLQDLGVFDPRTQERVLRMRAEFHLFNEQVKQVQVFHDRSFTLTGQNYQLNADNYEGGLEKLPYRAEALIREMNAVIDS